MRRREFLMGALGSVVYVACGSEEAPSSPEPETAKDRTSPPPHAGPAQPVRLAPTSPAAESHRVFPQGVASGDPRPDRVVLWTRVEPAEVGRGATEDIDLGFVVATDEALTQIVGRGSVTARAADDHTVRLVPTGLEAGRFHYYRFELKTTNGAPPITTQIGRTKTAPARDADVPVAFAFCSCQDFIGRYYHSWRALLGDKPELDFILFLGDYIYETVNDARFQTTTSERSIELPVGLDTSKAQDKSRIAALTLGDYRTLYKAYRNDELLREVHRLYPFIVTWDDHEFADDCWQDHSTSFNELDPITNDFTSEKNTARRMAASRAFAEYQPLDVVYNEGSSFPHDLQIYRQLAYGKHVDLFLTDQRSYRSDHVIPEGPTNIAVGKLTSNTMIGSRYFVRKSAFDPREAEAGPTLLGAAQKAWLLGGLKGSKATWKIWGNEVQMYQMALELGKLPGVPDVLRTTVYMSADQWDGYRSERAEVLGALADAKVENLLVCTGDIHSFYAAELHVDFDAPKAKPVGVEFVTAGISSASLRALVDKLIPEDSILRPVADHWAGSANEALLATNPHLRFADTDAYGFAIVKVDGTKAEATFVELGDPKGSTYPGVVGRKTFITMAGTNKVTAA